MEIRQTAAPGRATDLSPVTGTAAGTCSRATAPTGSQQAGLPAFVQENQSLSWPGHPARAALPAATGRRPSWCASCAARSSTSPWTSGGARPRSAAGSPRPLTAENKLQLFVPAGFAHGFCVLEDDTEVLYKCSDYYSGAADQKGVLWNDPTWAFPGPCRGTPCLGQGSDPTSAERGSERSAGVDPRSNVTWRRKGRIRSAVAATRKVDSPFGADLYSPRSVCRLRSSRTPATRWNHRTGSLYLPASRS